MSQAAHLLSKNASGIKIHGRRVDLYLSGKPVALDLGLVLHGDGWGSHVFRDCVPELSTTAGRDAFGAYQELRLLSHWKGRESDGMEARRSPAFKAGLSFRFYEGSPLAACWLHYDSEAGLAADGAAKVLFPHLHGFSRGLAAWRNSPWWTQPQFVSSPKQLGHPVQHLLWTRDKGDYGVLMPLGGSGAKASLGAHGGEFGLDLASGVQGFRAAETPLFVIGLSDDPYALCESAAELASIAMKGAFRPRKDKDYPRLFEGIGWCSWNTYYYEVDEPKLLDSARSFAKAHFPIHYTLVDDGWSSLREVPGQPMSKDKPWPGTGRMLWDFKADPIKFPRGLKGAFERLREICGVKELGVWHAFLGYWSYVHPESPVAQRLKGSLIKASNGGLLPDPREGRARAFYDLWYEYLRGEGVGFIKVDDQSSVQFAFRDILPLQEAAAALEHALQGSANAHFLKGALINCMAMSWENVGSFDESNVARSSNDFMPTVPDNGPQHLATNIYNSLWLSAVVTPDFDMFESHHPEAEAHALLRAVSGGPVYFTDKPGMEDWGLLRKLISADGRLLRADQPALPTRDMLFTDPLEKPVALKAFTRCPAGGALAVFNVFRGHEAVACDVRASDIEGMEALRWVAFEHFSGEVRLLGREEAWHCELEVGAKRLYSFAPIKDGFAPLGLLDKFLSLKAVEGLESGPDSVRLLLREAGRFGFYSERPVQCVEMGAAELSFSQAASGWTVVSPQGEPSGACEALISFKATR
jgi:raffinose synthase